MNTTRPEATEAQTSQPASIHRGGFTIIEVLIAVLVMVIGLVGVMAMQVVAIQANGQSRDLSEAVSIGEHFAAILQQDASNFQETGNIGNTIFLQVAMSAPGTWLSPYGEPVNALGMSLSDIPGSDKSIGRAKFCVEFNARWGLTNELISGYVMVYWPRVNGVDPGACADGADIAAGDAEMRGRYSVATIPYAVRRSI